MVLHLCPLAGGQRARLGANLEAVRFESFAFGSIQIDGKTYDHDVVLDRGVIESTTRRRPDSSVPRMVTRRCRSLRRSRGTAVVSWSGPEHKALSRLSRS